MVESHMQVLDKLNSLISGLERDMGALRASHEAAIESRNIAGVQLIDRNDELVILYDKSHAQAREVVEAAGFEVFDPFPAGLHAEAPRWYDDSQHSDTLSDLVTQMLISQICAKRDEGGVG